MIDNFYLIANERFSSFELSFKLKDMKLEKLLTLSQFVHDQRQNLSDVTGISEPCDLESCNVDDWNTQSIFCLGRINKYTDFLEAKLTEEFVVSCIGSTFIDTHLNKLYYINNEPWVIKFSKNGHHTTVGEMLGEEFIITTLHDLTEATNGELTLKNVTI